jgi:hypothetical protein
MSVFFKTQNQMTSLLIEQVDNELQADAQDGFHFYPINTDFSLSDRKEDFKKW